MDGDGEFVGKEFDKQHDLAGAADEINDQFLQLATTHTSASLRTLPKLTANSASISRTSSLKGPEQKILIWKPSRRRSVPKKFDTETWALWRDTIYRLYITENRTIKDVITCLNPSDGVQPSQRQLMAQIVKWGLRKHSSLEGIKQNTHAAEHMIDFNQGENGTNDVMYSWVELEGEGKTQGETKQLKDGDEEERPEMDTFERSLNSSNDTSDWLLTDTDNVEVMPLQQQATIPSRKPAQVDATNSDYTSLNSVKVVQLEVEDLCPSTDQHKAGDANSWDAQTVYSRVSDIPTVEKKSLMHQFADRLFRELRGGNLNFEAMAMLTEGLPDLLANFALRLGQSEAPEELRQAMVFLYNHRMSLCRMFESLHCDYTANENDDEYVRSTSQEDNMGLREKMHLWNTHAQDDTNTACLNPDDRLENDFAQNTTNLPDLDNYGQAVFSDTSFKWLCHRLRNKLVLTHIDDGPMVDIAQEVLKVLPKPGILRQKTGAPTFTVFITTPWSLIDFVNQQWPPKSRPGEIGRIVTLTGSGNSVQALTCTEYLQMTWPTSGIHFMDMIERVLQSSSSCCSARYPDGTSLIAWQTGANFFIRAQGTRDAIAEVAQQLTWLSAALSPSSLEEGVIYCSPGLHYDGLLEYIWCDDMEDLVQSTTTAWQGRSPSDQHLGNVKDMVAESQALGHGSGTLESLAGLKPFNSRVDAIDQNSRITMIILRELSTHLTTNQRAHTEDSSLESTHCFKISLDLRSEEEQSKPGSCWRHMFRNPVVVKGFPIRARSQPQAGLEVPLNVMAGLVDTRHVNVCYGAVYLKGSSSMLVPVARITDMVLWHFYQNPTGEHIAYLRKNSTPSIGIDPTDLGRTRHIVGWCLDARHYAGAAESEHKIGRARLSRSGPGCILKNCSVPLSRTIQSGVPFILLSKDRPRNVLCSGYLKKLHYLAQHFILLWDVRDGRGWLMNGVCTLLHLVRTSLKDSEKHSSFQLDWSQLQEAAAQYTTGAAGEVLSNKLNLHLKISHPHLDLTDDANHATHTGEHDLFIDRVEEFYYALERMIRYQEDAEEEDRSRCSRPRKVLEGWDFVDLIRQRDPLRPNMKILPTAGKAWVDFLRSIAAVTLFAEDFGELIQPFPTDTTLHTRWNEMPKNKYYIAVSHFDISRVMELHGDSRPTRMKVTDTLVWHNARTTRMQCNEDIVSSFEDSITLEENHIDASYVNVLWPLKLRHMLPSINIVEPADLRNKEGAVVFGYNDAFRWHWDDSGDPIPGPAPDPATEVEAIFHDSGLDTSLKSSRVALQSMPSISASSLWNQDYSASPEVSRNTYGNSTISGGAVHNGDKINIHYNTYQAINTSHTTTSSVNTLREQGLMHQRRLLASTQHASSNKRQRGTDTNDTDTVTSSNPANEAISVKKPKIMLRLYPSQGRIVLKDLGAPPPNSGC